MLFVWFGLVAIMITEYVVLDGLDLGAGVLHLLIAKTDQERRIMLRSMGPLWDDNEVWSRRRNPLFCLSLAVCDGLQRILSSAHDRALALDPYAA